MTEPVARHRAYVLERVLALTASLSNYASSWALFVFTVGTVSAAVLQRPLQPGASSQRLIEFDFGAVFVVATVASLLRDTPRARPALAHGDLAVLVACALTWFLPEAHAVYLGMTLAGGWLIRGRARARLPREIGQVWLALSLCQLWSKLAFKIAYEAVAPFEIALTALVGRLAFPDLHAAGARLSTRPDWTVVVLEGCSAFHNLSLAALVWLCVLKIAARRMDLGALVALGVSAGLVVTINVARLLAMLPSPDAYRFWHDGTGSVAVALASVAVAMVPVVVCVERGPRAGRTT